MKHLKPWQRIVYGIIIILIVMSMIGISFL